MSPDRKAGLIAFGVAGAVGVAVFVWLLAGPKSSPNQKWVKVDVSNRSQTPDKKQPKSIPKDNQSDGNLNGVNVEKVLWHMTHESNTIILFDDHGAVVSISDQFLHHQLPDYARIVVIAKEFFEDAKSMSGRIMATHSISGTGNRYTLEKAKAVLIDCVRLQSP